VNDITVFIFDDDDDDIDWLLSVAIQADNVVIDIDNCDDITKQFTSYMIAFSHVFYITEDDTTPYSLISRNRIKDLTAIIEEYVDDDEDYNENDEDDDDL
jgi:GTPase Era involved in 16S rRNA processing